MMISRSSLRVSSPVHYSYPLNPHFVSVESPLKDVDFSREITIELGGLEIIF